MSCRGTSTVALGTLLVLGGCGSDDLPSVDPAVVAGPVARPVPPSMPTVTAAVSFPPIDGGAAAFARVSWSEFGGSSRYVLSNARDGVPDSGTFALQYLT